METEEYYGGTYPEPDDDNHITLKVSCSFTTYIRVEVGKYKDPDEEFEDIERQVYQTSKDELLEECDKIEIEDWEEC